MLKASTSVTRTASEFMDCQAGAFNLCLGYRHPVAVQAIKDRADKLIHVSSSYQTHPINEMTSILAELAPAGLNASPTTSTRYSAGTYGTCPAEWMSIYGFSKRPTLLCHGRPLLEQKRLRK